MNDIYKKKYLKYKNKYLELKKQQFGGILPEFVEHGIGFNIKKFISIINSKAILSKNFAEKQGVNILQSHINATNGGDFISVSVPKSETSGLYSKNGITFIVNTSGLIDGEDRFGQLNGEKYIKDVIPIDKIISIYIPLLYKDTKLTDLNLCSLDYGSVDTNTKIDSQFDLCLNNPICNEKFKSNIDEIKLKMKYINKEIWDNYKINVDLYKKQHKISIIPTDILKKINKAVRKSHYDESEKKCSELYINFLSEYFKIDFSKFTLLEFIHFYLENTQNTHINIIHNL